VVLLAGVAAVLGVIARGLWIGLVGVGRCSDQMLAPSRGLAPSRRALPRCSVDWRRAWRSGCYCGSVSGRAGRPEPAERNRRSFSPPLVAIGGAGILGYFGRQYAQQSEVNSVREALGLPTPSGTRAVAPASADVADLSYTTANDVFYRIDTAIAVPRVDPAEWTLKIHGRVANPITLTFDDLLRRPMIERYVTLYVNGAGRHIGNAEVARVSEGTCSSRCIRTSGRIRWSAVPSTGSGETPPQR
jgi:hypothetical protein